MSLKPVSLKIESQTIPPAAQMIPPIQKMPLDILQKICSFHSYKETASSLHLVQKYWRDLIPNDGNLDLSNSRVGDKKLIDILNECRRKINITSIKLAHCPNITDKGLIYVTGLKALTHLDLNACGGKEALTDQVIKHIGTLKNLGHINLGPSYTCSAKFIQNFNTLSRSSVPAVSSLLSNYRLGDNARRYSTLMEKIYTKIPEPDDLERYEIAKNLDILLKNHCPIDEQNKIVHYFSELAARENRSVWEDRLLKMTIAIYKAIIKSGDESSKEILAIGLRDTCSFCSNRKSTEIERLYSAYVCSELMDVSTPVEILNFEMMQNRMTIRDIILNRICGDAHNATSHRFFRAKLNKDVFYLPPPILSSEDEHYANYAQQNNEQAIINAFREQYESPNAIYDIFNGLLHQISGHGENSKFKRDMFVQWLNDNGLMNADAFIDDFMSIYKPEIVIRYLEAMGFLKKNS